ncbi:MAG: YggS family pyridoxal phosphate-dependent enzyme [Methylococcales bacterium]|nr:YggS family pyridoxal phosphate-dependent enzyme [Methylococcales bacterium]MCK5924334.1 YggS family pyridoxal phosphate-dependent enzyme [Methylococcales bacterium]
MNTLQQNFYAVQSLIKQAEKVADREESSVTLLAVSKKQSSDKIAEMYALGQRNFGENYLQEALMKQQQLADCAINWHFIGPIQSNKTKSIAENFNWVHSVDRLKIAKRLSAQRPAHLPPLNICLQVNISDEHTKSGVLLANLSSLVTEVLGLKNICLRGVMAIPKPRLDYELQRQPYRKLHQAVLRLNVPTIDTFSFGMTGDLKAAIVEGATMVRIGTALFGQRL